MLQAKKEHRLCPEVKMKKQNYICCITVCVGEPVDVFYGVGLSFKCFLTKLKKIRILEISSMEKTYVLFIYLSRDQS